MLVALVSALVLPLVGHVIATIVDEPTPLLDLRGKWRVCFEKGECIQTQVPHKSYPGGQRADFHYLTYSRTFETTKEILQKERSLVFTQISEAATIELNGTIIKTAGSLPPNFRYSAHYPVVSTLSRDLLSPLGKMNEIKIRAYTTKIAEAGLRGELNGVFDRVAAVRYQEGKLLYDIVAPIFAAILLLALAYYALRVALKFTKLREVYWSYLWATLSAVLFLINYSKLTNEFLPAWLVGHMHFLFRNLMDWAFVYFLFTFYDGFPRRLGKTLRDAKKYFTYTCHAVFGLLSVLILTSLLIQFLFSDATTQAGFGASLPVLISSELSYLRTLPYLIAIFACLIDSREALWGRIASSLGMAVILFLQLHDIWIFKEGSTGIYFVKVFPLFVMYFYYTKINEIREDLMAADARHFTEAKTEVLIKRRISHDLKHPLFDLRDIALKLGAVSPELKLKMNKALSTLSEMSLALSAKEEFSTKVESRLLLAIIERVVEAKRVQLPHDITLSVDPSSVGVFVRINPTEFANALSNIISNASESYDRAGEIRLSLRLHPSSKKLELRVSDFGRGIDEKTQKKLFSEGATFGKAHGQGQGLFQARRTFENWGGIVTLNSKLGEGTSVLLSLPEAAPPLGVLSALNLSQVKEFIVIGDATETVNALLDRVARHAPELKIQSLKSATAANDFVERQEASMLGQCFFIVAESFKRSSSFSAVDFISKHGLQKSSVVLMNADDSEAYDKAKEHSVAVIYPSLVHRVRIESKAAAPGHELHVLIDNDRHVRKRWEDTAIKKGLRFQAFSSVRALKSELSMIPLDTKIFVDADIDGNFDGLSLAAELEAKGYNITIATGYQKRDLPKSASNFKLIGKTPPWIRGVPI